MMRASVLIIATAVVWGVLGTVQSKVQANGILLGGAGLSEVTSPAEGDLVSIEESKPISKDKRWVVITEQQAQ